MRHVSAFLAFSFSLVLLGCQTFPMASVEEDTKAKSFLLDADKASLYIIGQGRMGGQLVRIAVNGHALGDSFGANVYSHLLLTPGHYIIELQYVGNDSYMPPLPVAVDAAKQYFVRLDPGLTLVTEDVGRLGVNASRLMELPAELPELTPLTGEPALATIPLAVGVYYSSSFRNASLKEASGFFGTRRYEVPLGVSGKWIFDRALRNVFVRVDGLADWPLTVAPENRLDLVLVLRFLSAKRYDGLSASYSVDVFASNGNLITTLDVDGFTRVHNSYPELNRGHMLGGDQFGNGWGSAMGSAAGQLVQSLAKLQFVVAKGKAVPLPVQSKTQKEVGSGQREGFAVVPLIEKPAARKGAQKMQRCLEETLISGNTPLRIKQANLIRDLLFPWLEAGVTPSRDYLAELLGRSPIAERLERSGVRFVLFPTVEYVSNVGGPFLCSTGGCLGVAGGDETTKFTVPAWDVSANAMLNDQIAGETKGFSWVVGYGIPIWHKADTLGEACSEVSRRFLHDIKW